MESTALKPLILDTDVGTDVDDAFAIALAVRSPELDLKAVTTVYGDVALRARIARKLLNLLGRDDIPVAAGCSQTHTPNKEIYWGGWEGVGFLTEEDNHLVYDSRHAVDLMRDILDSTHQKVTLVAIGPLTNIAELVQGYPEFTPKIEEIICMAGTIQPGEQEWNVQCDVEAARTLFESGLPIKLGTRFIVNQPKLTPSHRALLLKSDDPVVQALVAMFDEFLSHKNRDYSPMYDPVTLSMAFTDTFIQTQQMGILVRMEGNALFFDVSDEIKPNMAISVSVEPELFINELVDRLLVA
jgi:purine nucleosidase